jgi:hypothetical protein
MRWPFADQPGAGGKVRGVDFTEFVGADGNGKIYRFPASDKGEHAICFMHKIVLSGDRSIVGIQRSGRNKP